MPQPSPASALRGGLALAGPALGSLLLLLLFLPAAEGRAADGPSRRSPNVIIVLADQWRASALGFEGARDARTPNLDRLASSSVRFANAISTCPVCCPYRATLLTGQRPLTHGVFLNDVPLPDASMTMAEVLADAGYDTAYIGKWHLDGRGRLSWTPPERRQGFQYWRAVECTHEYNDSVYYGDIPVPMRWDGYDAEAQTRAAEEYIRGRVGERRPFFLVLAWGPPHDPYATAPSRFARHPKSLTLPPNVPTALTARARETTAGYLAHGTALDASFGSLWETLRRTGMEDDTILVFTSDHGDLLGSHGAWNKQQPYEESIRVPLLIRYPRELGPGPRTALGPIATEDLMPTLLGLAGFRDRIPAGVEGEDLSGILARGGDFPDRAVVVQCPQPFGQWTRKQGGREYRALRTIRHLYARDLEGPWLLFDLERDPFQLVNLAGLPAHAGTEARLDAALLEGLHSAGDEFLPGEAYVRRWGYRTDPDGTVPYRD